MGRGTSPPSETNGAENDGTVTPGEQNATSTAPTGQMGGTSIASNQNDSEATKIVRSSPGV